MLVTIGEEVGSFFDASDVLLVTIGEEIGGFFDASSTFVWTVRSGFASSAAFTAGISLIKGFPADGATGEDAGGAVTEEMVRAATLFSSFTAIFGDSARGFGGGEVFTASE